MAPPIRDLEHRFSVGGRDYVLQVCGCGEHPAPVSTGRTNVVLVECVRDELLADTSDSPEKLAREVIANVKKFMPRAITPEQWEECYEAVFQWVCAHRAASSLRDHQN